MMILAGDVGGTSTRLGLFKRGEGNQMVSVFEQQYDSQREETFEHLVVDFKNKILQNQNLNEDEKKIGVACFGIAGPIKKHADGKNYVEMTNVPHWPMIEEEHLSRLLHHVKVNIINDMPAICYGIQVLSDQDVLVLNPGKPQAGNQALIAAGTGLGEAMLYWDGKEYHPCPSEGGHSDFAPRKKKEIKLLRYLQQRFPQVSYEQIISGSGLVRIYEFLRDRGYGQESETWKKRLEEAKPTSDTEEDRRPAMISEAGMKNEDALCTQALNLFVSLYGAEAGNLALKYLAFNGVYIGGGIAPKILEKLRDGTFMKNFTAKEGKFAQQNAEIPVKVILNSNVGLLGAAWYAAKG
ncbi:MAG: glucokinase [Thiotrichaceae bacterium IS1]|nr:MAG: glucokinase [Thiotrichaceae bacterium IS1]